MKRLCFCLLFLPCSVLTQEWRFLGLGTERITALAVDWSDPSIIYAGSESDFSAGTVGGIFKTTNAGAAWDTLARGVTVRDLDIHPLDHNTLYVTLGSNALTVPGIFKTTDGGITWTRADSGISMTWEVGPNVLAIDPNNPDTLYAGTAGFGGGQFYRSTNGSKSWHSFGGIADYTALAIHPDSSNEIYAGTDAGLPKSTDYGATWSLTGLRTAGLTYSIEFGINSPTVYVGSHWLNRYSTVGIFMTTDGGMTWNNPKQGLPDTTSATDIEIMNDNGQERAFLAAGWGTYQSIQGQRWERLGIDLFPVTTIRLSGRKLYAAHRGVYVIDLPTAVLDNAPLSPRQFDLYENFPNPFSTGTTIMYEIAVLDDVLLEIVNIEGRSIKTLVQNEQQPGKYSVHWNGDDENGTPVASGVYFCILRAKEGIAAKKTIYLR